jgi:HK97 gp10 family phage protein
MKIELSLDVEGLKDLEAALVELGDEKVRKASARRALVKVAKPIAEEAKRRAPVRRGYLERSIKVGSGGNVGKQAFAQVLQSGGSREDAVAALRDAQRGKSAVEISIGPGRHPQAIFQEFGTENHAPQPFMRPAWESARNRLIPDIQKEIWIDIRKTTERAERKAARLKAKG